MQPKEARKLVADALRSGKYKQGQGQLHTVTPEGDQFCCLGVACQVFMEQGGELSQDKDDSWSDVAYDGLHGYLPLKVRAWLNMDSEGKLVDAIPNGEDPVSSLVACNDVALMNFEQIADLFENAEFVASAGGQTLEDVEDYGDDDDAEGST